MESPHKYKKEKILNQSELREQTKLTLRKKRIEDRTQWERMNDYSAHFNVRFFNNEDGYEINLNSLQVSTNLTKTLEEQKDKKDKIKILIGYVSSPNITEKKYAIKMIEKILNSSYKTEFEGIKEVIVSDFISLMLNLIFAENQEKQIVYECAKILCFIIYFADDCNNIILESSDKIFQKIQNEQDKIVQKILFWIFCNLIESDVKNYQILMSKCPDLIKFIFSYIRILGSNIEQFYEYIDVLPSIFWLYSLILKIDEYRYTYLEITAYNDVPIIAKFLKTRINLNVFIRAVTFTLEFVRLFNDASYETDKTKVSQINFEELKHLIRNCDITTLLVEYLGETDFEESKEYFDCRENMIEILILLTPITEEITIMLNNFLVDNIAICLEKFEECNFKDSQYNNILHLYEALLTNCNSDFYKTIVRDNSVLQHFTKLYFSGVLTRKKSIECLIDIFDAILTTDAKTYCLTNLIIYKVPEFFFDRLRYYNAVSPQEMIKSIDCIHTLIEFCASFDPSNPSNCLVNSAKINGVRDYLEKLINDIGVDNQLVQKAEGLFDKYFKEDE